MQPIVWLVGLLVSSAFANLDTDSVVRQCEYAPVPRAFRGVSSGSKAADRRFRADSAEPVTDKENMITYTCPPLFEAGFLKTSLRTAASVLEEAVHIETQAVVYRKNLLEPDPSKTVIRVSAVTTGVGGCTWLNRAFNKSECAQQLALVDEAGKLGSDLVVLPEEFAGQTVIPCSTAGCSVLCSECLFLAGAPRLRDPTRCDGVSGLLHRHRAVLPC